MVDFNKKLKKNKPASNFKDLSAYPAGSAAKGAKKTVDRLAKHKAIIAKVKQIFPHLIVTGSFVTVSLGLADTCHDLDIILPNPTGPMLEQARKLQKKHPFQGKKAVIMNAADLQDAVTYKGFGLVAIFEMDGMQVDIFVQEDIPEILELNGIFITTLPHVIQSKKRIGRLKDWGQLKKMAEVIYSKEEIHDALLTATL